MRSESSSRSHIIDLISGLAPSQAPQTRSKAKDSSTASLLDTIKNDIFTPTPIDNLFVDGMGDDQIWAQLDLRTQTMCRMLDFVLEGEVTDPNSKPGDSEGSMSDEDDGQEDDERLRAILEELRAEEGDITMSDLLEKYGFDDEDEDDEGEEFDDEERSSDDADMDIDEEDISPLRDDSSDSESYAGPARQKALKNKQPKKRRTSELDDDFFNLADFNAYTERAEAKSSSMGRLSGDEDDDDEPLDFFSNVDTLGDVSEMDGQG